MLRKILEPIFAGGLGHAIQSGAQCGFAIHDKANLLITFAELRDRVVVLVEAKHAGA